MSRNQDTERSLTEEFPKMLQFFKERDEKAVIHYDFDTPGQYWLMLDFPLPQRHFFHSKHEKMLFDLNDYPEHACSGFYVLEESMSLDIFDKIFMKEADAFGKNGKWYWVPFVVMPPDKDTSQTRESFAYFLYALYYKLLHFDLEESLRSNASNRVSVQ